MTNLFNYILIFHCNNAKDEDYWKFMIWGVNYK